MSKLYRTTGAMMFGLLLLVTAACSGGESRANVAETKMEGATAAKNDSKPEASGPEADKKRIVSLSILHTSNLLALGIQPYGAVTQAGKDFLPHVADMLKGTVNLGNSQEPNLEAVVQAAPDLIIGQDELLKSNKEQIEKIAPLYSLPALGTLTWREQLVKLGEATGRVKEAHSFLAEYDAKLAKVKENVKKTAGDDTVMVLRIMPKELRLYGLDRSYGSLLYQDLGLKPVKGLDKLPNGPQAISREVLPEYDADRILLEVSPTSDAQTLYKELQASAIWTNMKSVKNGHVYMIDQQPWLDYSAMGMMKSLELADTLFASKK
ncbi:iron-siderophore ABC transporter substrate-binding protein [Paenibacillus hodogayensis]|uniref:Iron-siderophore ABC transporter substrate-binding protein n=1 Tax=Paenibacillus hodogayensis TaxID=279208 RepID=A0ABV5VT69_9BACL